jgi:UDP-N-acetylmuramoylalanine--D-glutamate ligase
MNRGLVLVDESALVDLRSCQALIASPGIDPTHPLYSQAVQSGLPVIGEVELASRFVQHRCIGITGTNGKTTVTQLVAHVLNESGVKAKATGNVGYPLCLAVDAEPTDTLFVIELSSWQLETLSTPILDVAVVLNISPDHLDRHRSMDAYAQAKFRIGLSLKPQGFWAIQDSAAREYAHLLQTYPPFLTFGYSQEASIRSDTFAVYDAQTLAYYLSERYRGFFSHDVENELAAYLIAQSFGITASQFVQATASFKKPPHRNEFVRMRRGVSYINDSKGTNIDAVVKAVASAPSSCVLIAGGIAKGASFKTWANDFTGRVRKVFAIGQAAPQMHEELYELIPVEVCPTMEDAVKKAAEYAVDGERVLLSPGCSSFDMFENYAQRGNTFVQCVRALPE